MHVYPLLLGLPLNQCVRVPSIAGQHATVLVTHHSKFARNADHLLVLNRDGTPNTETTLADLTELDPEKGTDADTDRTRLKATNASDEASSPAVAHIGGSDTQSSAKLPLRTRQDGVPVSINKDTAKKSKNKKEFVAAENREKGAVAASLYWQYLRAARSWLLVWASLAFCTSVCSCFTLPFVRACAAGRCLKLHFANLRLSIYSSKHRPVAIDYAGILVCIFFPIMHSYRCVSTCC